MLLPPTTPSIDAQQARVAAIVADLDDETLQRVRQAILDLATGYTRVVAVPRGQGNALLPQATWTEAWINGRPVEVVTAYVVPPDNAAIRTIMEFNIGRPGQRDMGKRDPVIRIHTTVPMPWELATRSDGSLKEAMIDDEIHAFEEEAMSEVAEEMEQTFAVQGHTRLLLGDEITLDEIDLDEIDRSVGYLGDEEPTK